MGQIVLNVGEVVTGSVSWNRTAYYNSDMDLKWLSSIFWRQQYNYGTRSFGTSRIPKSATVTSVSLTFSHYRASSLGGASYSYYKTEFTNTNDEANNTTIKNWLNNNKTDSGFPNMSLDFIIRGNGGTGTLIPSSATTYGFNCAARIHSIKLVINYEFSNGVEGDNFTTDNGVIVGWHLSPKGILEGEVATGTYSLLGAGYYGLKVNYRPEGFTDYTEGEIISVTTGTSTAICSNSFGYSDYSTFPNRATQMQISFDFYTDSDLTTFVSTDWIDSGVYFLKERAYPSLTTAIVDSAGYLEKYGRPIQNMSELTYTFTPTPDPYSDATITSVTGMIDDVEIEIVDNTYIRSVTNAEGTNSQMLIWVTDSYGLTTEEVFNLDTYTYTVPKIDTFKVSRYELIDGAPVFAGAGIDGAINLVASTADLGGQNTHLVVFSNGITETTLYSGTGSLNINEISNITLLNSYTFEEEQIYNCSISITDDFNTVTRFSIVRKSGAPLLQVEQYGVGIGKIPTGTITNPTFDCGMTANMAQAASFTNVTGITTLNFEGTEYTIQFAPASSAAAGFITIVKEEEATTDA